jgi:3-oxoacyl-[acyl-carrier protein] reductase
MHASYDFSGVTVVVTGASGGIGRATARAFAQAGASVAINSRNAAKLQTVVDELAAEGLRVTAHAADVRDWNAVHELATAVEREIGPIDVLVNNAGGNFACALEDMTPNGWRAILDLNLTSAFYCAHACVAQMKRQKKGAIVNVGSIAAFGAHPLKAHYGAAKAGLVSLTMTMAYEWAPYGIRVNCLAPGAVMTERSPWSDAQRAADAVSRVPMRRVGEPEEIARACMFLASDDASYVTGATIRVDGGPHLSV